MATGVGIIGLSSDPASWAARAHANPLSKQPLSKSLPLVAVATSSLETAAKSATKWGLPVEKGYAKVEDLAQDPDVKLAVVSVKLPMHRDLALPLLEAGKDVLVEWPLATNSEQVEELVEAAKRGGGKTYVGLQARTSPTVLKAKEIIDSGVLGQICASTILGHDNILLSLPPRFDYEHDAANRADLSTIPAGHILGAQSFLLGEYKRLTCESKCFFETISTPYHSKPVSRTAPDSFLVQGQLANDAVASLSLISTPTGSPSSISWTISGSQSSLRMTGDGVGIQIQPPKLEQWIDGKWEEVPVNEPFTPDQTGDLYMAIAGKKEVPEGAIVDFEGAKLRHRMLEACMKSAMSGTREQY